MKFIIVILSLVAFVAAAEYFPKQKGKCDFRCSDLEVPVCGWNGKCHQKFHNQCTLDHNNCLNTLKYNPVDLSNCSKNKCPLFHFNYKDTQITGAKL